MEHTYKESGYRYINIDNIACAPELDRLYTIETVGDNISADKAAYIFNGVTIYFDENGAISSDGYESCDESCLAEKLSEAGEDPDGVKMLFDDDADMEYCDACLVVPAGLSVADYIKSLSNSVNTVVFPLQTSAMVIQAGAFEGFSALTSMYIPPYVSEVQKGAFSGCSRMWKISLPATISGQIENITEDVGYDCVRIYGAEQTYDENESGGMLKSRMMKTTPSEESHLAGYVYEADTKYYTEKSMISSSIWKFINNPSGSDFKFEVESVEVDLQDGLGRSIDESWKTASIASQINYFKKNYSLPFGIKDRLINIYPTLNKYKYIKKYNDDCSITILNKNDDKNLTKRDFCITYPYCGIIIPSENTVEKDETDLNVNPYKSQNNGVFKYFKISVKGTIEYTGSYEKTISCVGESCEVDYTKITAAGGLSVQPWMHVRAINYGGTQELTYSTQSDDQKTIFSGNTERLWHYGDPNAFIFKDPHYISGTMLYTESFTGDASEDEIKNKVENIIQKYLKQNGYNPVFSDFNKLYKYHEKLGMCPFL